MIQLAACLARHLPAFGESRPDGELLAAFFSNRDEPAFAELVRRHGPLVWAACRRLLPDAADAEDAFQSAFLVLVRRANRLRDRDALGPWLYRVAVLTARNIRRRNARMMARRKPLHDETPDSSATPHTAELRADLDDALASLPEKYRTPLVLCHLQGWSRRDAAVRLGCPEGTLSSLLARGLDRLRVKLRVIDPAKALAIATPVVPTLLASSTVKAAVSLQLAGVLSATVSPLVEGVLRMFWVKKATAASVALFAVFGFGMGIGVSVNHVPGVSAGDGPLVATEGGELVKLEEALVADAAAVQEAVALLKQAEATAEAVKAKGKLAEVEAATAQLLLAKAQLEKAQKQRDEKAARLKAYAARAKKVDDETELLMLKEKLIEAKVQHDSQERNVQGLKEILAASVDAKPDPVQVEKLKRELAAEEKLMALAAAKVEDLKKQIELLERQNLRPGLQAVIDLQEMKALELQIEKMRAERNAMLAPARTSAAALQTVERQLAALEAKRAAAKRQGVVNAYAAALEITIAPKDANWPFKVTELGVDGKTVGSIAFDNIEILMRYLSRAGKDAKGPRSVRLTVQADTKFELVKQIIEACSAAGLKPPVTLKIGNLKSEFPMTANDLAGAFYRAIEAERP